MRTTNERKGTTMSDTTKTTAPAYEMTDKNGFEVTHCYRCGGCGRYSWNQKDLDKCYGCNGTGKNYTPRGLETRRMYEAAVKDGTPKAKAKADALAYQATVNVRNQPAKPNEDAKGRRVVLYKGRQYRLTWEGKTKYGQRAKLEYLDGSKEFWVACEAISEVEPEPEPVEDDGSEGWGGEDDPDRAWHPTDGYHFDVESVEW